MNRNIKCGFHGDQNLIDIMKSCVDSSDYFIETGTHTGRSLKYIASLFPDEKHFFSCEVDRKKYLRAELYCRSMKNTFIRNTDSLDFLDWFFSTSRRPDYNITFWLDAHWSDSVEEWSDSVGNFKHDSNQPLKNEIYEITRELDSAAIFVDDMKVPDDDWFKYDVYGGVDCSHDNIELSIRWDEYTVFYPNYHEEFDTMYHDPTGWGLITNNEYAEKIKSEFYNVLTWRNYKR